MESPERNQIGTPVSKFEVVSELLSSEDCLFWKFRSCFLISLNLIVV